jgi:hypothetical protein
MATVPTDSRRQYPGLLVELVNAQWGRAPMAGVEQVVPGNFYILAENPPAPRFSGIPACVTLPPLYQRCPWHGC